MTLKFLSHAYAVPARLQQATVLWWWWWVVLLLGVVRGLGFSCIKFILWWILEGRQAQVRLGVLGTIINSCVYVCVYVVCYIYSSLLIDVFCGNNETSWELVCVCWVGLKLTRWFCDFKFLQSRHLSMLARSGGALKVLVLFHTKPKGSIFFLLWDSVLCPGRFPITPRDFCDMR